MLYEFIRIHRDQIITRYRARFDDRAGPGALGAWVDDAAPLMLDHVVALLRNSAEVSPDLAQRLRQGFQQLAKGLTVAQVVRHYTNICQAITEVAVTINAAMTVEDFRTLDQSLDDAVAAAMGAYGRDEAG